jgi:hypothetical protein
MFNRIAVLFVALTACVLVASGTLTKHLDTNGHAPRPRPPQIDPFDLMSKARGLPDEKIENLF